MFAATLPLIKKPLHLNSLEFETDLTAIYNYLKIRKVFCQTSNPFDYKSPQPTRPLRIIEIAVPPGTPSYLKSVLQESLGKFSVKVLSYLQKDETHHKITRVLNRCIQKTENAIDENNYDDSFSFDHFLIFLVYQRKNGAK